MSIKKHKEYHEEIERLNDTKAYLENTIATVMDSRIRFKDEIKDAYIHLDFLDSSLSYSSIMLNSKLLDDLEKNFDLLIHARKKPYFARIDIRQNDKDFQEKLYIGKVSLLDDTMETPLVIDWRAPIASVYYDGRLGETNYIAADEEHTIDLIRKRQYTIETGELITFMDVDISTTDAFLQASLDGHAGEKLKDIVSTIQAEQNQIIRADIDKPLIVQGVAGSGKTTIALHRIAYLIYTYANKFSPKEFMIIAPNNLFLDYISQVLPELGADKVHQTTYIDFMMKLLGKKVKLSNGNQKLLTLLESSRSHEEKTMIGKAAQFKNGMQMKNVIENYVRDIMNQLLPNEDFVFSQKVIVSKEAIDRMFFEEFSFLPIYGRLDKIKLYLSKMVKSESKKILHRTAEDFDKQIESVMHRISEPEIRRNTIVSLMDEKASTLSVIEKESKNASVKYINQIKRKDLFEYYERLMSDKTLLTLYCDDLLDQSMLKIVTELSKDHSQKKQYELEDLASLVYLKQILFGLPDEFDIKYAVIDEAQDFSAFQFFVLKEVLKTERFTILGDLSQGIHGYRSVRDWTFLRKHIFKEEATYLTLQQSYRTTVEIMNLANKVIRNSLREDIIYAKPVVRHGEMPFIYEAANVKDVTEKIEQKIMNYKKKGFTTIAIISKTLEDAQMMHKKLFKSGDYKVTLMDEKVMHYDNDIVIIPSYLAKGLEFDAVIVFTLDDVYTMDELDLKLMYVAMTRPLHQLSVVYMHGSIAFELKETDCDTLKM